MMRVKALQQVFYDGRDRDIGEVFDTLDDMHARVLVIAQKVEVVPAVATADMTADAPATKSPRYRRRDMRAQK